MGKGPRMDTTFKVSFSELVTLAVETGRTNYLTTIPEKLLSKENTLEKDIVDFIEWCGNEGFVPTIERLEEKTKYRYTACDLPIEQAYLSFCKTRQQEVFVTETNAFMEDNEKNERDRLDGVVEFVKQLTRETEPVNPRVINYNTHSRASYNKTVYRTSTFVPFMDECTKGLIGGDFVVFMGAMKSGKSTLIKMMARAAYANGENVVFCSQEQSPESMSQQMDLESLGYAARSTREKLSDEMMNKLLEVETKNKKRDNKMFITPQVTSVAQLDSYVKSLGVPVHKIFIDGLNLMSSYGDTFGSLAQVCSDLKSYAINKDCIIVAVTHGNRNSIGKQDLDMTQVAGSIMIPAYSDFFIGLAPLEEKGTKRTLMQMIASRWGGHDMRICITEIIAKDNTRQMQFADVDPEWNPNESNLSLAMKEIKALKSSIEDEMLLEDVSHDSVDEQGNVRL